MRGRKVKSPQIRKVDSDKTPVKARDATSAPPLESICGDKDGLTYADIFESAPHACLITDVEGIVTIANGRALELLRADGKAAVSRPLADFVVEEDREAFSACMATAAAAEAANICHARIRPLAGTEFPAEIFISGILDKRGRPCGAHALIRDISVQRRTERVLSETNELLEKMFSNIHILVAYLDTEFNFIRVNRAYAAADARKAGFFVGKNHFDLYPNEENEAIFRKVVETGMPVIVHEKPFVYPDAPERGVTYWDWSLAPVKEADGTVVALVFSLLDVTLRKRSEMASKDSERKYRALVEEASDGIAVFDGAGRIAEANTRMAEITGFSREELKKRRLQDLAATDDGPQAPLGAMGAAEESPWHGQRQWRRKDGRAITVEATASKIEDGVFQAIVRDVSDRKRAEDEIRLYQQRLRLMASQLSLAEERERRRISKDIHDHVGQTLALCQIKLGGLLESAASEEAADSIREIREYIYRIIKYTRSLTFELGSPILYELGIEAALQEIVEDFQRQYRVKCAFVDDGHPKLLGSDMRIVLFRAVRELLTNVIKHARAGEVIVSVNAGTQHAELSVADDGIGFEPCEIGSHVDRDGGYGLFSIRERLEHLGGSLEVESVAGRGTKVTLRAPLTGQ